MTVDAVEYDPKRAVMTGYFVLLAEHDKETEIRRAEGDWTAVNGHQWAIKVLANAMEYEDKDPVPAGLGK